LQTKYRLLDSVKDYSSSVSLGCDFVKMSLDSKIWAL
jgi:hypothetical protein